MSCTEEYKEHIEYTFHAFCVVVIRNAKYTALRDWSRKHKSGVECITQHRLTEIQSKRNTNPIFDGLHLKKKPSTSIMRVVVQSV